MAELERHESGRYGLTVYQSNKKRALPRAERDARILAMRALGQPLTVIADRLGCGERTVRRVVARRLDELNRTIQLDSQRIRAQHLLELEQLRSRLAPLLAAATPSDRIGAVRTWLQLLERESRLLGLNQPVRMEMAAHSAAAEALLQHLTDRLDPSTMETILDALSGDLSSSGGPAAGSVGVEEA